MSNPYTIIQVSRAFVSNLPVAPLTTATCVLVATHPRPAGGSGAVVTSTFATGGGTQPVIIDPDAIEEVDVTFHLHNHASNANGLRAYITNDGGATWVETDLKGYVAGVANQPSIGSGAQIQVPTLSAGQEWAETFRMGRYRGFAIEYTAGVTPPTAVTGWSLTIAVKYNSQEN